MKVLIIKLSALGDVVQALPVAMAVKRQMPEARVDWVVESPAAGLLEDHPALSRVLVSPRREIVEDPGRIISAGGPFVRELREVEYDFVLDLQGLMKSAMVMTLSRGERKVGFKGGKEFLAAWALNKALPPYDPDRHALERYLDLLEPLGLMRPAQVEFGLTPGPEQRQAVLKKLGLDQGQEPLVVLHPVALWESKLWPVGHWAILARELASSGARLVITGSAADRRMASAIKDRAEAGASLKDAAGRLRLKELAALLAEADAVACTDTGVMHLAAAVGGKVAAIFGPTAPWRTGPFGGGHRIVRLGADCSPCFKRECENPYCMSDLKPAQVAEAIRAILG